MNYINELYHHGVKGMKWGVRKERKYQKWKSKNHALVDKRYDRKERKIIKKANKLSSNAITKRERREAADYERRQLKVNNLLRKMEHTRISDVSRNDFKRDQSARATTFVAALLGGLPGAAIAGGYLSGDVISYRATREDREKANRRV